MLSVNLAPIALLNLIWFILFGLLHLVMGGLSYSDGVSQGSNLSASIPLNPVQQLLIVWCQFR